MRLLFISLSSVVVLLMVLFMTRIWGLGQVYAPYDHPFLHPSAPWTAVVIDDTAQGDAILPTHKDAIFWLNLISSSEGAFLVFSGPTAGLLTPQSMGSQYLGPKTYSYPLNTLRIFFPKAPRLEDFFQAFPNQRFILNINDNAADVHKNILATVEKAGAKDRVLYQSDIELVLKSIKELSPRGLFGTSLSDIMRLLTFDSINLAPASPYYGDVFVTPLQVKGRPALNSSVIEEIRRRKKFVILGPLQSEQEQQEARSYQPDGVVLGSIDLLPK